VTPSLASVGANLPKLEIGAGEHPCEGGFIHNDVAAYPHIEWVGDGSQLPSVNAESLAYVRAAHVLEHFSPWEAITALCEWRRVLVPEGVLELALPNGRLLVDLWDQGQLTYAAMIRDMMGLPPATVVPPTEAEFRHAWERRGWSGELRDWLYAAVSFLPHGNGDKDCRTAQTHRWAYSPRELEALLSELSFHRIHVKIDGTALHAWAAKAPTRPRLGVMDALKVVRGQAPGAD